MAGGPKRHQVPAPHTVKVLWTPATQLGFPSSPAASQDRGLAVQPLLALVQPESWGWGLAWGQRGP